ncbi:hypothetical protein B0T17DRAFT_110646 [Bombardia bombarda]|uniref:Uncharacterized protein n=1 Tax=Bombardia bombarda TaxID=252184 RepID=A0AA39TRI2_9PEZI|nr:hypothetical protein B0T17DRAFT_110646 [Bombardia bombarda]
MRARFDLFGLLGALNLTATDGGWGHPHRPSTPDIGRTPPSFHQTDLSKMLQEGTVAVSAPPHLPMEVSTAPSTASRSRLAFAALTDTCTPARICRYGNASGCENRPSHCPHQRPEAECLSVRRPHFTPAKLSRCFWDTQQHRFDPIVETMCCHGAPHRTLELRHHVPSDDSYRHCD